MTGRLLAEDCFVGDFRYRVSSAAAERRCLADAEGASWLDMLSRHYPRDDRRVRGGTAGSSSGTRRISAAALSGRDDGDVVMAISATVCAM